MMPVPWIVYLQDLWRRFFSPKPSPNLDVLKAMAARVMEVRDAISEHRRAFEEHSGGIVRALETTNERLDQIAAELRRLREG